MRPDLVHLDVPGDLPGVIGDDPRGRATEELGERALALASTRAAAALDRALAEPREPCAHATEAGLAALERLWQLRQELPREQVPPVQTPAWIEHLERFRDGDWAGRDRGRPAQARPTPQPDS